jgi:fumarate hydratase subunit beta
MAMRKIIFPVAEKIDLHVFDEIEIFGRIFCGRDAALPKLVNLLEENMLDEFGLDLKGSVIFHTAVSSAGIGPTSSNKLEIQDSISPLSRAGVKLHLGKGTLDDATVEALASYNSYFAVTPPVSALLSSRIVSRRIAAFPELGMEALYELEVSAIPAIIAVANGKSIAQGDDK